MRVESIVGSGRVAGDVSGAVILSAMAAVTMKQMHQWAGKYQKERENSEKMRAVFGQQEKRADGEKSDQYPFAAPGMLIRLVLMFMLMRHGDLL